MIGAADYEFLRRFLKERSGLSLSEDKHYLLQGRLEPLARRFELQGLAALVHALRSAPLSPLAEAVVDAMTTNESLFFRDKRPFELLTEVMLPTLIRQRPPSRTLRIWCAAASTGQEPYSIAMLLHENAPMLGGRRVEIIGTDISSEALERADAGIYNQFEVQRGLPINFLLKYFTKSGELWQVVPTIRNMVEFRRMNLLHPYIGLGTFDVVFCRNVLIYFEPQTKASVLDRIAGTMALDGYLVLGGAETILGLSQAFATGPHRGYYQRVPQAQAASA